MLELSANSETGKKEAHYRLRAHGENINNIREAYREVYPRCITVVCTREATSRGGFPPVLCRKGGLSGWGFLLFYAEKEASLRGKPLIYASLYALPGTLVGVLPCMPGGYPGYIRGVQSSQCVYGRVQCSLPVSSRGVSDSYFRLINSSRLLPYKKGGLSPQNKPSFWEETGI